MILLIIFLILVLLLLDFTLIGFLPGILKIWHPLSELTKDQVLIEDTAYYSIKTDITDKTGNPVISRRINYKSVILTPKYLIVKNTRLTYLLKIDIGSVTSYVINQQCIGKKIVLSLTVGNEKKYFRFRTKNSDDWIKQFSKIGLQRMKDTK